MYNSRKFFSSQYNYNEFKDGCNQQKLQEIATYINGKNKERNLQQNQALNKIKELSQYENFEKAIYNKQYSNALSILDDMLKPLKDLGKNGLMSYYNLLKLRGHTLILAKQYENAPEAFSEIYENLKTINPNQFDQLYQAQRNLLVSYIYSDLMKVLKDGSNINFKQDTCHYLADYLQIMGVAHFLNKDYKEAKALFQNSEKLSELCKDQNITGKYLNNYGMSLYMDYVTQKQEIDENKLNEIIDILKDSLKIQEESYSELNDKPLSQQMQKALSMVVKHGELFPQYDTEDGINFLQTTELRRIYNNIAQILFKSFENQIYQSPTIYYWVFNGLNYNKKFESTNTLRSQMLLGMFYDKTRKDMMADTVYEKANNESEKEETFDRVQFLRTYGKHLSEMDQKRQKKAQKIMKQADELQMKLKPWHENMDLLYLPQINMI